jgi:RNA-directed DNA polymerase
MEEAVIQRRFEESITRGVPWSGIGRGHSSAEAGESPRSEGPRPAECVVRCEENRLPDKATTDDRVGLPEAFAVNRDRLPVKLFTLRQKLYLKAKREPTFRFYALYDRIYRRDVLWAAWAQVAENDGAPGVDGVTIQQIVDSPGGPALLVETLHGELQTKTYRPDAVLRVLIPKPDGRLRPLGIPTIRDRVVQTAAKLILEPIVEADFLECSYGYRPARSAEDALGVIEQNLRAGYTAIYDADMQAYFDTIPHDKLLKCVERRIADRSVLHLLRLWLNAVVEERDEDGRRKRSRSHQGTPQGGVISPLLANLYLHWFDVVFHRRNGPGVWAKARLVRYADDFIIMARFIGTRITTWVEDTVERWLALTINRKKTRVVVLSPREETQLDFLGYTFRYAWDRYGRSRRYLTARPSAKAMEKHRNKLRDLISHERAFVPLPVLVQQVNQYRRGWAGYFRFGHPRGAYRASNAFTLRRLAKHLRRRSQRPCRPPAGMTSYQFLTCRLGLQLL